MGLFDKLLDKGAKALGDMVSDKLSDVVNGDNEIGETFRSVKSAMSAVAKTEEEDSRKETGSRREVSGRMRAKSFEEKLQTVLQNAGNYELRKRIAPEELEQEYGAEIYTRGGCYCAPNAISYGIYEGGGRILLIRLWRNQDYRHMANRQIKSFCSANGIKLLDFFDHLPNEEDYMDQRIREQLV